MSVIFTNATVLFFKKDVGLWGVARVWIERETQKALGIQIKLIWKGKERLEEEETLVWIPKSQIQGRHKAHRGITGVIVPAWLAEKKEEEGAIIDRVEALNDGVIEQMVIGGSDEYEYWERELIADSVEQMLRAKGAQKG